MGIIDFVKDAGEKIFGGKKAEGGGGTAVSDEQLEELAKGNALFRVVRGLGLQVEDLKITFDDGVATVYGKCPTQAEKEKVILAVGNTAGVARVDDRLQVEKPEPEATLYTVKSGDSLSKIAKEHYGDANRYMTIFEANQPLLKDPDKIYPGQVLRIPPQRA